MLTTPSCLWHELEIVEKVKYLGVIIQSAMKFTAHIQRKLMTASQQLGIIKRVLYWAPTNAKLLTYKSLCLPHPEYAAAAWDPSSKKNIRQNNSKTKQCDL